MEKELIAKADILANWILEQAKKDSLTLTKAVGNGEFDLVDRKIVVAEEAALAIFYEFVFLNFFLCDFYAHAVLQGARGEFQQYVIEKVEGDMGLENDDSFIDIYNERMQGYSKYKTLYATLDEGKADSVFWAFGKRICRLLDSSEHLINAVAGVERLAAHAWGDLHKLQLFPPAAQH